MHSHNPGGAPLLLERAHCALLLVDVQEKINRVMADQRHVGRIAALLTACRQLSLPVVATEQYPEKIGVTLPELRDLLTEPVIAKLTFSCLREPTVRARLGALAPRQLVVVGIEAHVCVLQTAADLIADGVAVHVPHDAVASRRPGDRDTALQRLAAMGATVTTTESILFELLERAGTDEFRAISSLIKGLPVD